jgi:hypothetical protein
MGGKTRITSTNPNANPNARTYSRFSEPSLEVVEARSLQGVHFRSPDVEGRKIGRRVAKWVFKNALRPWHGNPHGGVVEDEED